MELLQLREEMGWLPDLEKLKKLAGSGVKLIALTNPNNPTGALIPREMLEEIAAIARSVGAWILCDEVYRGTDQKGQGMTASMADIYEKGISTAGMSKAYSLAGLRLGWITAPDNFEPKSGTTALVKFDLAMSSYEFCISLLKQTGVMFTPGSSFGMEGYARIGYANNPKILKTGLERVSDFLLRH